MSINHRIKEIRQTVKLTQLKFANRIAISTSYLAEMELDVKKVNERTIRLISLEFGVDEHWLKTGEGSMFSGETDAQIATVTSLFRSLSPQFQECAVKQLNELTELYNSLEK